MGILQPSEYFSFGLKLIIITLTGLIIAIYFEVKKPSKVAGS